VGLEVCIKAIYKSKIIDNLVDGWTLRDSLEFGNK
jgi:hypothetical protein